MLRNLALYKISVEARKEDPKLDLVSYILPATRRKPTLTPALQWGEQVHKHNGASWIPVKDVDSEYVPHREFFLLKQKLATNTIRSLIPAYKPMPPQYFIKAVSEMADQRVKPDSLLPPPAAA